MSDVIHLLPDNVANQIAAGEVIQRPASVLKELVENSMDAGASCVKVIVKDAGRTLLQVIDDGKGMSDTDARLCFERHATSKISSADDLFSLRTMGFRGEALPSIASVSQLELNTRRDEDEMGTCVVINGGSVESQLPTACPKGTNIAVRNLFYNVPARRKFLKSNTTEFTHIEREFFRIVLVNPQTEFELYHNDKLVYQLKRGSLRERIVAVFGKSINAQLLSVEVDSTMVKIGGYVGKPESAKKQNERQYFFVNGRYMRHPYFHKAVLQAFDRLVAVGTSPDYFLYFEVDPSKIDVNIHPTKTEIKFENDQPIWSILMAGVKEALGKFNVVPTLDFEYGAADVFTENGFFDTKRNTGQTSFSSGPDTSYNPFATGCGGGSSYRPKASVQDWQSLYAGFESEKKTDEPSEPFSFNFSPSATTENQSGVAASDEDSPATQYLQFKGRYILTVMKSGIVCIDQHRAHAKVLFERYSKNMEMRKAASQRLMFPVMMDVVESEAMLLDEISEELSFLGFDISNMGKGSYAINGIPSDCKESDAQNYLRGLLEMHKTEGLRPETRTEKLALRLAEATAVKYGQTLTEEEMMRLVSQLFSLPSPDYTIDGHKVLTLFTQDEIEKKLK